MTSADEVDRFYRERVPAHFARCLEAQETSAAEQAEAARLLDEMRAVRTSLIVRVEPDSSDARRIYCFEIERGRMRLVDEPTRAPFLILDHALADFAALRRECGDSVLGFLGALAGLGDEMKLTAQRVRSLRELAGSLVFELAGPTGFSLVAHFGVDTPADEPRARIRLDEETFAKLRSGALDPQDAFLDGLIDVEGDIDMAIRLALASASPD
jgi:hypothetical protein